MRVVTGELTKTSITLINESDESIAFEARAPSCACLKVSRKRVELSAGERFPVELTIHSEMDGFRTVELVFVLQGGDQAVGLLQVPYQIWSGPDVYIAPNPLQLSAEVGEETPGLLTVFVLLPDTTTPLLSWRPSTRLQLVPEGSRRMPDSVLPIAESTFKGLLLDQPAGFYLEDLSLECRWPGGRSTTSDVKAVLSVKTGG